MPIVSGNVSLYNETDGQGILPTPTIGAVGLIASLAEAITGQPAPGDLALLVGTTTGHLGQSALLAEVFHREEGDAPPVDLAAEKAAGAFILANRALIGACSDLSDGGLALAAFEMAEAAGLGVHLDSAETGMLFGEDQGRYLLACGYDAAEALMVAAGHAGVPLETVGRFGGDEVVFGSTRAPLEALSALYRSAFAQAVA
jgi:phosphoribosylformylglycinamidine synthase